MQEQCEDWYVVRIMADLVCESNFVVVVIYCVAGLCVSCTVSG